MLPISPGIHFSHYLSPNRIPLERFATEAQSPVRVAAWIDEYNRDRERSSLVDRDG